MQMAVPGYDGGVYCHHLGLFHTAVPPQSRGDGNIWKPGGWEGLRMGGGGGGGVGRGIRWGEEGGVLYIH